MFAGACGNIASQAPASRPNRMPDSGEALFGRSNDPAGVACTARASFLHLRLLVTVGIGSRVDDEGAAIRIEDAERTWRQRDAAGGVLHVADATLDLEIDEITHVIGVIDVAGGYGVDG